MPKISVIANFYNSAKYIPKLIQSILHQSFKEWEFIAVNDCSPSNDLEVLKHYQNMPELSGKMKIVNNKTNQGISKAKAIGIKEATGTYLTFIDGDDWLEPNALQCLYDAAISFDADIVCANSYRTYKFGIRQKNRSCVQYKFRYTKETIRKSLLRSFCGRSILNSYGYWGKLYKKSVILKSGYQPREITLYEDLFFNLYTFLTADSIIFIEDFIYNWRWGGISSASFNRNEVSFGAVSTLKNFNDFYFEKINIEDIQKRPECITSLKIELINVLSSSFGMICSKVNSNSNDISKIKDMILEVINLPAYREALSIIYHPYFKDKSKLINAIAICDVEWLYGYFHEIYKNNSSRRLVRLILSYVMK